MSEEKSPFPEEQDLQDDVESVIIPLIALAFVSASRVARFDQNLDFQEVEDVFVSKMSEVIPKLQEASQSSIKIGWDRFKKKEKGLGDMSIDLSDPSLSSLAHDIFDDNLQYILDVNRRLIQAILDESLQRGWSERETLKYFKKFFGVTPLQFRQALAYEDSLINTLPKIPKESVDKVIDERADKLIDWRISLIAVRMSVSIVEASKVTSWSVIENKLGFNVDKKWVSVIDDSTTDTCLETNSEVVPLGSLFSNGVMYPPAINPIHPCRSSVILVRRSE